MSNLTRADADSWTMHESAHYNGGKVFFAYLAVCNQQPRLSRFDRYERATQSVTSTWRTDGVDAASMDEAIERLNTPPVFTDEERAFLATIPAEYTAKREIWPDKTPWEIMDKVRSKGAVEWHDGKCRITEAGCAAIAKASANTGAQP